MRFFASVAQNEMVRNASQQITPLSFFGQRELLISDLFKLLGKNRYKGFYDPFSGSGSISFAAMECHLAREYYVNDSDPIFKQLWTVVRENPQELIASYSAHVEGYCRKSKEERDTFYKQVLQEFNELKKVGSLSRAAVLFAFLINFSHQNMPLFDQNLVLATQPNTLVTMDEGVGNLSQFKARSVHLSVLLKRNNVVFSDGDFLESLETATKGDVVILDPPYPTQAKNIYFKISTEETLQKKLRSTLKLLNERGVHFIILYGAVAVELRNQFDEESLGVRHLVRLSTSRIYGDGLEHIYVSRSIPLKEDQLPVSMAFYHSFFAPGIEISQESYREALGSLQSRRDGQKERAENRLVAKL